MREEKYFIINEYGLGEPGEERIYYWHFKTEPQVFAQTWKWILQKTQYPE